MLRVGRNVANWTSTTARNMLPERTFRLPRPALAGGGSFAVPVRLLTVIALVLVLGILAWSVFKAVGDNKQVRVNTLLEQAKQEELLANQPGTQPTERITLLQSALQHAQQAAATEVGSPEAQVFADKVQGQLDQAQGITRLSLALLFQFGQAGPAGEVAGDMQSGISPAAAPAQPTDLIVSGNEAFVLDRATTAVYKCNISAKSCVKTLGAGDIAGGQSAGQPVAITTRQGNGDAGKAGVPKDIATYDGNLYLLGSKPGQVSKFFTGKYGDPSDDWIKDPATAEQLTNPVAIAIDGSIYVLLADGKILVMQGGKITGSVTPKPGPSAAPPTDLFTSPETHDLYVLKSAGGAVTRVGKDGQTLATFMGPAGANAVQFSGFTVDEAKGEMYLVSGNKVYHASLSGGTPSALNTTPGTAGSQTTGGATTQNTGGAQPNVQPTAEP
jgi:hypothetical protein